MRAVSAGDSVHSLPGIFFITYSHAIAPLVRDGTIVIRYSTISPPTGYDCASMALEASNISGATLDLDKARAGHGLEPHCKATLCEPSKGTDTLIQLEPLDEGNYFWQVAVDEEPRDFNGSYMYVCEVRFGKGKPGANGGRSLPYFFTTLEGARAHATKCAHEKLRQGSKDHQAHVKNGGRLYKRSQGSASASSGSDASSSASAVAGGEADRALCPLRASSNSADARHEHGHECTLYRSAPI